jgi:hypothetical protein
MGSINDMFENVIISFSESQTDPVGFLGMLDHGFSI